MIVRAFPAFPGQSPTVPTISLFLTFILLGYTLEEGNDEPHYEDAYENFDLKHALELLPPRDRMIVELKYFEDMKLEDIAAIMEENTNTIKSRLYRSLKKLRLSLD